MADESRGSANADQETLQKFVKKESHKSRTKRAEDGPSENSEGLTYAEAGVDIEASEATTDALIERVGHVECDYAGLIHLENRYLALTTDGVGTKILVAGALDDYSTVGIDCVAMNVNDLIAVGVDPIGFVDYLAIEEPDQRIAAEIGEGIAAGMEMADTYLVGGETAILPDMGVKLAGACMGFTEEDNVFPREAQVGDALVGWPSSGIHSNGLTLAREAVTRDHEYTDSFPPDKSRSIGEVLLEPTRIYADLLHHLHDYAVHAAAHITGGGWTNLERMGEFRYEVTDPLPAQPVFEFVQECGSVTDAEMHRTFNMGAGFVVALHPEDARSLADVTEGRVIGHVEQGTGVTIRGLEL